MSRIRKTAGRVWPAVALVLATLLVPATSHAQQETGSVIVRAVAADAPVRDARVRAGHRVAVTNEAGEATLRLPAGEHSLRVERLGFRAAIVTVLVRRRRTLS